MSVNGYRDYFKVLGVERGADADTIKRSFRKLARQCHPDVNPGDQGAEARFKEISEAYEVLSDPDKRRRYEQFGQYWNQMGSAGGAAGADVDFGRYGNFDDFVNDLLGRFGGAPGGFGSGFPGPGAAGRGAPINLDAEASINLPLGEAFRGCERTLAVNEERVQVRIPAGVKDGSRLRLKGKGWPLKDGRGDLLLSPVLKLPDQLSAEERQLLEQLRAARSADPRAGWIQSARL